jgi:MEDS: MEthanogen/methylotroph, DcmR Sensory domain
MQVEPRAAHAHTHRHHVVQLYGEDDGTLTSAVGTFVTDGLARGEGAVVIATAPHRDAFAAHLAADGRSAMEAVRDGRLLFLDAAATLDRFMVNGQPDWLLFTEVIGGVVAAVQARTGEAGIRAYGEMVGLLWTAGQVEAAVRLEEYWNAFLASRSISLFCGYPVDIFGEGFDAARLAPILCAHTHVLTVNGGLDRALDRAMDELLGAEAAAALRAEIAADHRPEWGALPRAEATVLWLRRHRPAQAGSIVERARFYRASYLHAH